MVSLAFEALSACALNERLLGLFGCRRLGRVSLSGSEGTSSWKLSPGLGVTPGNLGPGGTRPALVGAAQGAEDLATPCPHTASQGWWQLGLGHIFEEDTMTSCRAEQEKHLNRLLGGSPPAASGACARCPLSQPDPSSGVPSPWRKAGKRSR